MKLKSFIRFFNESIETMNEVTVKTFLEKFGKDLETKMKSKFPDVPFKYLQKKHILDQIVKRSNPDPSEPKNILITKEELDNILGKIYDRVVGNESSLSDQTSLSATFDGKQLKFDSGKQIPEWEFQHKIKFKDHFRCVVYVVELNPITKTNAKGKVYKANHGLKNFRFITIFPSNVEGMDNPKYKLTNRLEESINLDYLNYIED